MDNAGHSEGVLTQETFSRINRNPGDSLIHSIRLDSYDSINSHLYCVVIILIIIDDQASITPPQDPRHKTEDEDAENTRLLLSVHFAGAFHNNASYFIYFCFE